MVKTCGAYQLNVTWSVKKLERLNSHRAQRRSYSIKVKSAFVYWAPGMPVSWKFLDTLWTLTEFVPWLSAVFALRRRLDERGRITTCEARSANLKRKLDQRDHPFLPTFVHHRRAVVCEMPAATECISIQFEKLRKEHSMKLSGFSCHGGISLAKTRGLWPQIYGFFTIVNWNNSLASVWWQANWFRHVCTVTASCWASFLSIQMTTIEQHYSCFNVQTY